MIGTPTSRARSTAVSPRSPPTGRWPCWSPTTSPTATAASIGGRRHGPRRLQNLDVGPSPQGIGSRRAVVVLEPDALGLLKICLSAADQRGPARPAGPMPSPCSKPIPAPPSIWTRATPLDCRAATWPPASAVPGWPRPRLRPQRLELPHHRRFIGLRQSNWPLPWTASTSSSTPAATAPAPPPTTSGATRRAAPSAPPPPSPLADPLVDAYCWIKRPGESDGTCNGGPAAGGWWPDRALELARLAAP